MRENHNFLGRKEKWNKDKGEIEKGDRDRDRQTDRQQNERIRSIICPNVQVFI